MGRNSEHRRARREARARPLEPCSRSRYQICRVSNERASLLTRPVTKVAARTWMMSEQSVPGGGGKGKGLNLGSGGSSSSSGDSLEAHVGGSTPRRNQLHEHVFSSSSPTPTNEEGLGFGSKEKEMFGKVGVVGDRYSNPNRDLDASDTKMDTGKDKTASETNSEDLFVVCKFRSSDGDHDSDSDASSSTDEGAAENQGKGTNAAGKTNEKVEDDEDDDPDLWGNIGNLDEEVYDKLVEEYRLKHPPKNQ